MKHDLELIEVDTPRDFGAWCQVARKLIEFVHLGEDGEPRRMFNDDRVYDAVTFDLDARSRREKWKHPFSGCAYSAAFVLDCLGVPGCSRGTFAQPRQGLFTALAYHELSEAYQEGGFSLGTLFWIGTSPRTNHLYLAGTSAPLPSSEYFAAEYGQTNGAGFNRARHHMAAGRWYRKNRAVRRRIDPVKSFPHRAEKMRLPKELAPAIRCVIAP